MLHASASLDASKKLRISMKTVHFKNRNLLSPVQMASVAVPSPRSAILLLALALAAASSPDPAALRLCRDPSVDAVMASSDGTAVVFKGALSFSVRPPADAASPRAWPVRVARRRWPALPSGALDAVLPLRDGRLYAFRGSAFWRARPDGLPDAPNASAAAFPRALQRAFPGLPPRVDAAALTPDASRAIFFSGSQWWEVDPRRTPPVRGPRPLSCLGPRAPPAVDAALTLHGRLVLVTGRTHVALDQRLCQVEEAADPPYPRDNARWLLGCPEEGGGGSVGGDEGGGGSVSGGDVSVHQRPQKPSSLPQRHGSDEGGGFGGGGGDGGVRNRPQKFPSLPQRLDSLPPPPPPRSPAQPPRRTPPQPQPPRALTPPPPPERPPPAAADAPPALCRDARPDAVLQDGQDMLFIKEGFAWRVSLGAGVSPGQSQGPPRPVPLHRLWPGFPPAATPTAAYRAADGSVFLLADARVWRFVHAASPNTWKLDRGYPREAAKVFPGAPTPPDAVLAWPGYKLFFFKGSLFWKFDPSQSPPVGPTYPNVVSHWAGLPPDGVDAAAVIANRTLFFSGGDFYLFDEKSFTVAAARPPFPRSTARWLLRCSPSLSAPIAPSTTTTTPAPKTTVSTTPAPTTPAPACSPRPPPPPAPAAPPPPPPSPCRAPPTVDAVLGGGGSGGGGWAVHGAWAWALGAARGQRPVAVAGLWPGLPASVDAAFMDGRGRAVFFKGEHWWRFVPRAQAPNAPAARVRPRRRVLASAAVAPWRLEPGFPRPLCRDWPGVPPAPDAALRWGARDTVYFFKGSLFWKFDPSQSPPVGPTYPNVVFHWAGLPPDGVDAAAVIANRTVFFSGGDFYLFDEKSFTVPEADPPYPRLTASEWFGCPP